MRTKQPGLLDLLESYLTEYMPFTAGLSANTIRLYQITFRLLFEFLYEKQGICSDKVTFQTLNYKTLTAFLDWLETERKCSTSTRNVRLTALSSFASYAQNRNFTASSVFANSVKKIPAKKTAVCPRIFFTREEVSVLLRTPDCSSGTGRRDAALLSLMYASGARAQEICDLRVRDILFDMEHTKVTITGKGSKTRRIIIARPCADTLKRYLVCQGIDKCLDSHVFSSRTHEHMTISCVEAIFKKYVGQAKRDNPTMFLEKHYPPHSMRHTCAMHMMEAGVPLMAIKNFLGHSTIATTERYAQLTQGAIDKYIKEWNQRWFKDADNSPELTEKKAELPDFLR